MRTDNHRKDTQVRRILDGALRTIATDTISGSRMRQFARAAGMSQGNLHYYFPSKTALFTALLEEMLRSFVEERQTKLADSRLSPGEKLWVFLSQMQEILVKRGNQQLVFYDFWVQGTRDTEMRGMMQKMYGRWRQDIEAVVAEGIRLGEFDPEQASIIPTLMVSLMEGAALQYLIQNDAVELNAYFETAHEVVVGLLKAGNGGQVG